MKPTVEETTKMNEMKREIVENCAETTGNIDANPTNNRWRSLWQTGGKYLLLL